MRASDDRHARANGCKLAGPPCAGDVPVGFFGIIFAVNGYFLYSALSTHTGVVANEPYRKGLAYNERIAADEQPERLGWRDDADARPRRPSSRSSCRTRTAAPVRGLHGHRPWSAGRRPSRHDRELRLGEIAPGAYVGGDRPARRRAAGSRHVEVRTSADEAPIYRFAEAPMAEALSGMRPSSSNSAALERARPCMRMRCRSRPPRPRSSSRTCTAAAACAKSSRRCGGARRVASARVNLSSKRVVDRHAQAKPSTPEPFIDALARCRLSRDRCSPMPMRGRSGGIDQDYLKRLGVAGFAAANIMLLSVSVWSGQCGDMPRRCRRCSTGCRR